MVDDDRRVRRTRKALAEALVALCGSQPYERISIRDITERADVGYATFFRHYAGKDELMLDVFQGIMHDLETLAAEQGGEFFQAEGRLIFQHVHDHPALYRSLLDSVVFTRRLKNVLAKQIDQRANGHHDHMALDPVLQEIALHHMLTGLVGLIEWWLARDCQPSVEQMAQVYERLVVQGTWQALQGEASR